MKLRSPLLTGALAAIAVVIHLLPPAISNSLQFERTAIEDGQWWRLLTAHFTHFGANHLIWDTAVFLAFGTAAEFLSRWRTAVALCLASIAISVAVQCWQPQFAIYRGLSGLDCALFGILATSLLRRADPILKMLGTAATFAVIAKCAFELETGSTAFASGDGYAPVPLAHLVGFLSGFFVEWSFSFVRRQPQSHAKPLALRARSSTTLATARARCAPSRSTAST